MKLDMASQGSSTTPEPALSTRSFTTWPLLLGTSSILGTTVVLGLVLPRVGLPAHAMAPVLGVLAPLATLLAAALAARAARPGRRATWIALGGGVLVLVLVRALQVAGYPGLPRDPGPLLASAGLALFHLALALAAVLAMRRSSLRPRDSVALLDAAITFAAAALLLERFLLPAPLDWAALAPVLTALVSFFCAVLLALRPGVRVPGFVPLYFLVAASCLLLGSVLDTGRMDGHADPAGLASLAGWTVLALTGFGAVRASARTVSTARSAPRLQGRIHQILAPAAALLLGGVAIDAALSSEATLEVGLTGAFLGVLLALRVQCTLQSDEEHAEAQRLLAQNSALVEVSRALADATELSRTLDLVARLACQILDAPAAGVELLDVERDELEVRALHGLPKHLLGLRTPVEGTLTGSVVRSGVARAVADLRGSDFRPSERIDAFGAFPTAAAPLHYRDQRLGALFALRFDRTFDEADIELLGALADQASLAIRNAQLFEQVRALSLTDPLTGLANRRQLARDLNREFAAAVRGRRLIAVIFDLDNFKEYNDRYGHPAGDEVLRLFGQALAAETRAMNLAARYGGDEFVALLADTTPDGTEIFIERVAARFRESMDQLGHMMLTISAGYAEYSSAIKTPADLIAAADKALYRVKPSRGVREGEA